MILFNFFIGLFAIFIAPQIFLHYKYKNFDYSLRIISGFILSFSSIWILTLLSYYFNIPNKVLNILAISILLSSLIYLYKYSKSIKSEYYIIWIISFILILPLFQYAGTIFNTWDAVVSWHRWALELYNNEYHPINAAYPVLIPALWSILYKIQGSQEIWWTAKIALYTLPFFSLLIPLSLYQEYKNRTFLFIAILMYPYLLWNETLSGYVDIPVMLIGMLSLTTTYAAEINKKNHKFNYYIYASLFLAGIASITKQAGLAFIVFDYLYILINLKYFNNKKHLGVISIGILLYFISYLSIYYLNATYGVTGNIEWLKTISKSRFEDKQLLWDTFFSYPPNIPFFNTLLTFIHSKPITPYLMFFSLFLFILKDNRKLTSMNILSTLFLIVGFFAWSKYFSYDARNSYWVKTFLIMLIAININHFFLWLQTKKISTIVLLYPLFLLSFLYFYSIKDEVAFSKQKKYQSKLATELSNDMILNLFNNKKPCLKLYTNYYFLLYDWDMKPILDKIIANEYNQKFIRQSVENNCSDGAYIIFRGSTPTYPIWRKQIRKLIKDKKILSVNESRYLFYVPPYSSLSNDYFEPRTEFIHKEISKYTTNIRYYLDIPSLNKHMITLNGWAFIKDMQIDDTTKYIVLRQKNKTYIVETKMQYRPDVTTYFKAKNLMKSGFQSYIYKKDFSPGDYSIEILLEDKSHNQYLIKTNHKITI